MTDVIKADVVIVGAGLAGLSAAVALSGAGLRVALLERKAYIGGRAYSYAHPALGEVIDSQHVLLGCCTNLLDLCRLSGADGHLRWYDTIPFLEPSTSNRPMRRSDIGPSSWLPAPAHNIPGFLTARMLTATDKIVISQGLLEFLRGFPADDSEAFSAWIQRTGQTANAVRHFWEPLVVATLNDSFERCSTRYAGKVFHESFLRSPAGGRLGIPTLPLSEFYSAFARKATEQGTTLYARTSVERLEQSKEGWTAIATDGTAFRAPAVLLALPFEATAQLLTTLPEGAAAREVVAPLLPRFVHAPITTIHFWFDREITDLDQAALLDTRIQWLFNKSRIRRDEPHQRSGEHYLELTISASFPELRESRQALLDASLRELALFFPPIKAATVLKSGVLKEARATFSVTPGLDQFRPASDAAADGLFLAGDWTRTDWPSTMEGAVRSGRLAAEAIARAHGLSSRFVTPDMAATGLSRWIAR